MKLEKPFYAVPAGAVYPVWYVAGDECPPELETVARSANVLAAAKPKTASKEKPAPVGESS